MNMKYMYIISVHPKKKEVTIVFSDRLLYNLVPFEYKIQNALLIFFEGNKLIEVDDKNFLDAVKPETNSTPTDEFTEKSKNFNE